jgi:hypothetical protein
MSIPPDEPQPPASGEPLQFDKVEFADAQASPTPICSACKEPITGTYYTAGEHLICPPCHDAALAAMTGGSRVRRFLRAMVFGVVAGIIGGAIWFGVRKVTGYEIGLIAIVVGLVVGAAVRKGSDDRGGRAYQFLAVFLTYSCIVSTYIPEVYGALNSAFTEPRQVASASRPTPASTMPTPATTSAASNPRAADADTDADKRFRQMSAGKKVLLVITFVLILFGFAFIAPVLTGFSNIIGLLIIGFALWEAWKINRKRVLAFTGPHLLGPTTAPAGAV